MRSAESQNIRLRRAAFIATLLIYGVIIGVNLDPAVTKAQVGVAGDHPLGIPTQVFFIGSSAILFLPIFWWTPQLLKLHHYASQKKTSIAVIILSSLMSVFGLIPLLTSVDDGAPREIKNARNIVVIGLVYIVVLMALWIVLATLNGV